MDPEMINCIILLIHVENKIILSHAIQLQTSVSAKVWEYKKTQTGLVCTGQNIPIGKSECNNLQLGLRFKWKKEGEEGKTQFFLFIFGENKKEKCLGFELGTFSTVIQLSTT